MFLEFENQYVTSNYFDSELKKNINHSFSNTYNNLLLLFLPTQIDICPCLQKNLPACMGRQGKIKKRYSPNLLIREARLN